MRPRILSLFSGYGGLDLALHDVLGAETAYVADIEPGPRKVLAHRFPNAPNLGDVTKIDWAALRGQVDIIAGGSPCQDLSHAGKRAGMTDGTRSNLWVQMREAIATIRPGLVAWENVRGALSATADSDLEWCPGCMGDPGHGGASLRALGRVVGDLAELGYDARWVGLRAADVGACHGRYRVFLVAHPHGEPRHQWRVAAPGQAPRGWALGDATGCDRAPLTLLPTPLTSDAKALGPGDLRRHEPQLRALPLLLPTPSASQFNDGEDVESWQARRERVKDTAANGNGFGMPLSIAVRLLPTPAVADVTGGRERRGGTRSNELLLNGIARYKQFGEYAPAIARQAATFGLPAPDPTEPGKNGPRLSARFAEWMMGLPAGWVTGVPGVTRSEALRLIGNGVFPQQAAAALRWLLTA